MSGTIYCFDPRNGGHCYTAETRPDLVGRSSGLGDFREAVAGIIAGGDLDKLVQAIYGVQDRLIDAINARPAVIDGYRKAFELADSEMIESARMGVRIFARQVQTISELNILFMKIAEALSGAGLTNDANGVNQTVVQLRRFETETNQVMSGVPEYSDVKWEILSAFNYELSRLGVSQNDYSNPEWISAYCRASAQVVPFENEPSKPWGLSGLFGLGELSTLAVAILWGIAIVAAAAVAAMTISKIISALNIRAETQQKLILDRNQQKEQLRLVLHAQGIPQAAIDMMMQQFDTETKKMVDDVPKSNLISDLAVPVGIGVLVLIGLKAGGVI